MTPDCKRDEIERELSARRFAEPLPPRAVEPARDVNAPSLLTDITNPLSPFNPLRGLFP